MTTNPKGDPTGFDQAGHNVKIFCEADVADSYLFMPIEPCEVMMLIKYRSDYFRKSVLDIGVGTGRTTRYLLPFAATYLGIDLSEEMLVRCRTLFPEASLRKWDMRKIGELEFGPFDFVFGSGNILDAVSHEERLSMLRAIHGKLIPGGLLAFSAHNRNWRQAGRGPVLGKSRNPITLLHNYADYLVNLRNHRRMIQFHKYKPEFALLNDVSHSWKALNYYISREAQKIQLLATGFELLEVFDEQGIGIGEEGDDSANGWLLYVCRRLD